MKRIHWLSMVIGMVVALTLVGACTAWQKNQGHSQAVSVNAPSVDDNILNSTAQKESKRSKHVNNDLSGFNQDYATIEFKNLPHEAQIVIAKIKARENFPYRQDGQTFSNREQILPAQVRGYYQEYTVPTPGADNRGARRIISGRGATGDVATAGEFYYTADHYRTFSRVKE